MLKVIIEDSGECHIERTRSFYNQYCDALALEHVTKLLKEKIKEDIIKDIQEAFPEDNEEIHKAAIDIAIKAIEEGNEFTIIDRDAIKNG